MGEAVAETAGGEPAALRAVIDTGGVGDRYLGRRRHDVVDARHEELYRTRFGQRGAEERTRFDQRGAEETVR